MKRKNPISLPVVSQLSMAVVLAAALSACGGGTATGEAGGENGGGGMTDDIDTDGDGLSDAFEDSIDTNPLVADSDEDGLDDGAEWNTYFTDPTDADSDDDGLSDGAEVNTYLTSPTDNDSDDDDLTDGEEINTYQTDPNVADSDGDGVADGVEVGQGGNPNDSTDAGEPAPDACTDFNSSNDEWIDNCQLRRFGTYARSTYTQGVQRILWCQGFDEGVTDINTFADGAYGPQAERMVREFQQANSLAVDGIVGPNTWEALFSTLSLLSIGSAVDEYSIDGCSGVQFYKLYDGLVADGWQMAETPGSETAVEFGTRDPVVIE